MTFLVGIGIGIGIGIACATAIAIAMLDIFPKVFSQTATSQGYFPSVNFATGQFPKSPQRSAPIAACGVSEALTLGKLPLGKLHIWEILTREIFSWVVSFGKTFLGKYLTPPLPWPDHCHCHCHCFHYCYCSSS